MNEIFISYAWKDNKTELGMQREMLVDKICSTLAENKFKIVRDKATLSIGNSIRQFMHQIGKGNYVIIVVSDKYLRSEYCMFEAVEILKIKGYEQRIFPIVLPDANVYSHEGKFEYINYWRTQQAKIEQMIQTTLNVEDDFAMLNIANKIVEIAKGIDDFLFFVSDKLSINPETNFDGFINGITTSIHKDNECQKSNKSVLVAGTGAFNLPPEVLWCTTHLGKQLAQQNYKLITGGWQGVDYVISDEFSKEVYAHKQKLSEKLIQIVPNGQQPEFKGGTIKYVEAGAKEWLESLKLADVVILIGGQGGTYETYTYAKQENIPVIPIVCTNGDAKAVFDNMLKNWNEQNMGNISIDKFKTLNQYIDNEQTAEMVCNDVMEMVNEIVFSQLALK